MPIETLDYNGNGTRSHASLLDRPPLPGASRRCCAWDRRPRWTVELSRLGEAEPVGLLHSEQRGSPSPAVSHLPAQVRDVDATRVEAGEVCGEAQRTVVTNFSDLTGHQLATAPVEDGGRGAEK